MFAFSSQLNTNEAFVSLEELLSAADRLTMLKLVKTNMALMREREKETSEGGRIILLACVVLSSCLMLARMKEAICKFLTREVSI